VVQILRPIRLSILIVLVWWVLAAGQTGSVVRLDGTTITAAEIEATVNRLIDAAKVTGIGIAILNDRRLVYLKAFGARDVANNLPLTPDSVMTAASYTKSTFAVMVMQLVQAGILDLDKPIHEYLPKPLPSYPEYQDLAGDERHKRITARMLLSHTAGFHNLRILNKGKLQINFEPGSRYAYSGEGIQLLQFVVETITNTPVNDLMRARIFKPFGMTRTSMVWEPAFETDYANAYNEWGRSMGPRGERAPGRPVRCRRRWPTFRGSSRASCRAKASTPGRERKCSGHKSRFCREGNFRRCPPTRPIKTSQSASVTASGGACSRLRSARRCSKKATTKGFSITPSCSTIAGRAW
jgi:CubicO group peptidase (beta-lactamase class C family)